MTITAESINLREGQLLIPTGSSNCQTFSGGVSCPTNSSGIATVNFTVTMQPGDNFAVAASTNDNQINAVSVSGTDLLNGSGQAIQTGCDATDPVCRSEMLTVWRRLHIEVDSMGASQGNFVLGTIPNGFQINGGQEMEITVNPSPNNPLEPDRFENGRLAVGRSLFILRNTTSTVTVLNTGSKLISVPGNSQFQLYDDDDFNATDGINKDGDTYEDIPKPPTSFLTANGDDQNVNVLAPAYIHPVYDIGDNNDYTVFAANVSADTPQAVRDLFDFDQVATEASTEFWTVYLLGGYQYTIARDGDPVIELPDVGITDVQNGRGSIVFMETNGLTECTIDPDICNIADTAAHEIGHLLNANEGDGGIMDRIGHNFSSSSLKKIRDITHP